jgi:hypothetical protein
MAGSNPFINKGIGQLPDETTGLAAFANAFIICLFLYSPCFAVRDASQKFIRGRTSYRRTLLFHLAVSSVCTLPLLVVSLTPVLDGLVLRGAMRLPQGLMGPVKRAVLAFLPIPTLIILRGVHQAVHITNDTPKWIGIGTGGRFLMILAFVFLVGVPLGFEGGVIGGLAISIGMATEMVVNVVTSRRRAGWLRHDPPGAPPPSYDRLWGFCGPLFLANMMGVFLQPLTIAVVNGAIFAKTSAAAYGIVRSFTWFFSSTLFAMQTIALAKADSVPNLKRLARFEVVPVTLFTLLFLVTALVPAVRTAVLGGFFEIDSAMTVEFVTATLPIALLLPGLMAVRSTTRGLLMRGGKTGWVSLGSLGALVALLAIQLFEPSADARNGAVVGYICWVGVLGLETLVLLFGAARVGLAVCVSEGFNPGPPPVRP